LQLYRHGLVHHPGLLSNYPQEKTPGTATAATQTIFNIEVILQIHPIHLMEAVVIEMSPLPVFPFARKINKIIHFPFSTGLIRRRRAQQANLYGSMLLFRKFDVLSTKIDAFLTPGYDCRSAFTLTC
jgi:hypothetical protein